MWVNSHAFHEYVRSLICTCLEVETLILMATPSPEQLCKVLAIGLHGLQAGTLLFISGVSIPTFLHLVTKPAEQDGEAALKKIFPCWWNHEHKMSIVLAITTAVAHFASWWFTKRNFWLCSGALAASVLPWSIFPMGDFVTALRTGQDHTEKSLQKYAFYQHFKPMASITGLAVALVNIFRL